MDCGEATNLSAGGPSGVTSEMDRRALRPLSSVEPAMTRPDWNVEQAASLAPDAAGLKAGQKLASASKWQLLGVSDVALWGEVKGSGKNPYQVAVDWDGPAFKCSCPSRKFPCKHAVALTLVFAQGDVPDGAAVPAWAQEWLAQRKAREEKRESRARKAEEPVDEATAARRAKSSARRDAVRRDRIDEGVTELRRWIEDLIRRGLSTAMGEGYRFWDEMAARMVDAQLPGLGQRVRALASSAHRASPGELLDALARLHLLLEAHSRLDALPESVRADVSDGLGLPRSKEEVLGAEGVSGPWRVMSSDTVEEGSLRVRREWFQSVSDGRFALELTFAPAHGGFTVPGRVPGSVCEGELVYYPGSVPERALFRDEPKPLVTPEEPPEFGWDAVPRLMAEFADALARNPWVERVPGLLLEVTPRIASGERWLEDSAGRAVRLVEECDGWKLAAVSGGRACRVFGEFDGERLHARSVFVDGTCYSVGRVSEREAWV